ncbi:MAG: DEAD/DEAH box helicase [Bdellovibrionota bacterium]
MSKPNLSPLQLALQKAALPGVWSRGVSLAKDGTFYLETDGATEVLLRYHKPPVSPKITLWPEEADWHCDCGDRNDPCTHSIAAFLAYRDGLAKKPDAPSSMKSGCTLALEYRFFPQSGYLYFDRFLIGGKRPERLHNSSLVSLIGGLQTGRTVTSAAPIAGKEDFAVDHVLGGSYQNPLDRYTLTRLLAALQGCARVLYGDEPVEISAQTVTPQAQVTDDGARGIKLDWHADGSVSQLFKNGAALCGRTLKAVREPALTSKERASFRTYGQDELHAFASEILPSLESKLVVHVNSKRLPKVARHEPRIVLHLQAENGRRLSAYPQLFYGNPAVAEVQGEKLVPIDDDVIPERDLEMEDKLRKRLHTELQLQINRQSVFEDESALLFVSKVRDWECSGNGLSAFTVQGNLSPDFNWDQENFRLSFHLPDSAGVVDPAQVLDAWKENRSFVNLEGGGWAALPHDWLLKYADRVEAMIAARPDGSHGESASLPAYLMPDLAQLCEEEGVAVPDRIKALCARLLGAEALPRAPLPSDLKANLRSYQRKGIDWLLFLREAGMGALLADDMGLGKTLQSIACIEGRTLIVCPTSVLQSWSDQIAQFRPSLKVSLYHGGTRALGEGITLTSYGILRIDQEELATVNWDTVILDETQIIKNPDSQIARAAHRLRGGFRIALSGTPVENKLDDLWSQFQFLNPGLLWKRSEFLQRFGEAMKSGNPRKIEKLRARIRPFLLRRKKTDVAPELPPRTEVVLHADLGEEELGVYRSILAASRQDVLDKLGSGGSVFAALEMLLRLRQACCHPFLVPGSGVEAAFGSAKLSLLMESLEESLDLGHRALIFSQWTSLLDLVETRLNDKQIRFSRLDGGTRNRDQVVSEFQKESGPPVMLLSLKAGGVGITLTAADHIYILDPWWNPAAEDQAADRAHRIGQLNPVFIHRLVARNTVEDKILQLQKKKKALADGILSDSDAAADLTKDDILDLLQNL